MNLIERIWNDPVLSQVIAWSLTGLIVLAGAVLVPRVRAWLKAVFRVHLICWSTALLGVVAVVLWALVPSHAITWFLSGLVLGLVICLAALRNHVVKPASRAEAEEARQLLRQRLQQPQAPALPGLEQADIDVLKVFADLDHDDDLPLQMIADAAGLSDGRTLAALTRLGGRNFVYAAGTSAAGVRMFHLSDVGREECVVRGWL